MNRSSGKTLIQMGGKDNNDIIKNLPQHAKIIYERLPNDNEDKRNINELFK